MSDADDRKLQAKVLTVSDGVVARHPRRRQRRALGRPADRGRLRRRRAPRHGRRRRQRRRTLTRDERRLRRADRVDRRHRLRAARPDARGHAPGHRARGAGPRRGDAAGQPARPAVARHRRRRAGRRSSATPRVRRRAASSSSARSSTSCRTRCACCKSARLSTDARRIACCACCRLVLPKGSLEKATLELFEAADLPVRASSAVDYKATIDDPRIAEVRILRPQEIPSYVAEGLFDLGITGRDWVEETPATSSASASCTTRRRPRCRSGWSSPSPATRRPSRIEDLPQGVRVSTEYPELTARFFAVEGHRRRHPPVATARARRRSPTSPTASSTSPRPAGRCAPPGCGSSTRSSSATPRWSPTRRRTRRPGQAPRDGPADDAADSARSTPAARCWSSSTSAPITSRRCSPCCRR